MPISELQNFRRKFPQYSDLPDEDVASRLARKYPDAYGDLLDKLKRSASDSPSALTREFPVETARPAAPEMPVDVFRTGIEDVSQPPATKPPAEKSEGPSALQRLATGPAGDVVEQALDLLAAPAEAAAGLATGMGAAVARPITAAAANLYALTSIMRYLAKFGGLLLGDPHATAYKIANFGSLSLSTLAKACSNVGWKCRI